MKNLQKWLLPTVVIIAILLIAGLIWFYFPELRFPLAMLIVTMTVVIYSSQFFWDAGAELGTRWGIASAVLLLGVALTTSLPELAMVTTMLIVGAMADIVGTILGSDLFNQGLALIGMGLFAVGTTISGKRFLWVFVAIIAMNSCILAGTFVGFNRIIAGGILTSAILLVVAFFFAPDGKKMLQDELEESTGASHKSWLLLVIVVACAAALLISAYYAHHYSISVVGILTLPSFAVGLLNAIGSSLPELAVSLPQAWKQKITVANLVVMNLLSNAIDSAGLAIATLIRPFQLEEAVAWSYQPIAIANLAVSVMIFSIFMAFPTLSKRLKVFCLITGCLVISVIAYCGVGH